MRSSGPQATRRRLFVRMSVTLSERGGCPLLDKTPKVRFRTVFAPTGAPSQPTDSTAPESEAPSLGAGQGGGSPWGSLWNAHFWTLSVFFFQRWTFLRGRLRHRSPSQIKHPPQDVGNRTEGNPEAPVFFSLTLSERSVCPLLDKTPKVRFRTVFAPTGAPSRRTGSIVPDTEALSPVASRGDACLWESGWTPSFRTLSVFPEVDFPPGRLSTPLTAPDRASSPGCGKPNRGGEPGGTRLV